MPRKETTDRLVYRRLEELRRQMDDMTVVRPEDMSQEQKDEFLACVSEIVKMEREIAAVQAIKEAISDGESETVPDTKQQQEPEASEPEEGSRNR